ncbi:hypothetical protein C7377_1119 [Balneicella halophila]|uniref:DUF2971 family protein n=1 Tax=Balneicella halophila TaxID=1537566 RepID=A0A7L4UQC8_BALHA|nr:DUF2971 domain-containing protein [Balneicella halophila]PVX50802.1 hypothetical protein C7377_1119 [Balneicella halophila]
MRIYHYTSLEALALILKNRTIRFNRLDKVDDLEEGNLETGGVKFGKYVFVSCWTEESKENVPLWKMYGGDYGAVRISLHKEMFKEYIISANNIKFTGLHLSGAHKTFFPPKIFINPYLTPFPFYINYNNDVFYKKIVYVDNVISTIQEVHKKNKQKRLEKNQILSDIDPSLYASYKNKRWEFQNESRFIIHFRLNKKIEGENNPYLTFPSDEKIRNQEDLGFDFYDMHLKDEAFDTLEITLSPSVTTGQEVIVESLRKQYAPKAKISQSSLANLVQLK